MPRFSEAPISDHPAIIPPAHRPLDDSAEGSPALDRTAVGDTDRQGAEAVGVGETKAGERAKELIRSIGSEFSRLRKQNRSGAWADLEDKIAKAGDILISSGMISSKDWVGMLIDIEQFRKSEGGTAESPGDALAKWLSEGQPKRNKVKVKTQ